MGCNHPLRAFWTGDYTDSGKKEYVIYEGPTDTVSLPTVAHRLRRCDRKLVAVSGGAFLRDPVLVPCGHCVGCRMARAKEWQQRLVLESMHHKNSYFVTLTYDDLHATLTKDGKWYLKKDDLTRFLKRFRYYLRSYSSSPFRYFACGEYGTQTGRAHFHLIFFMDFDLPLVRIGDNRFHCLEISLAWPCGLHELSYAEPGCMSYVAGYVLKKQRNPDWDRFLVKPYVTMSRMPAIGSDYLFSHSFESDSHVYGPFGHTKNGNAAKIPRAFLRKIELIDEKLFNKIKAQNLARGKKAALMDPVRFGTSDPSQIGFSKDQRCRDKLRGKKGTL